MNFNYANYNLYENTIKCIKNIKCEYYFLDRWRYRRAYYIEIVEIYENFRMNHKMDEYLQHEF